MLEHDKANRRKGKVEQGEGCDAHVAPSSRVAFVYFMGRERLELKEEKEILCVWIQGAWQQVEEEFEIERMTCERP